MLARWYMLSGQFSVTFEYRPGAQHANAESMSRQCGQCMRPGCPVSSPDSRVDDVDSTTALLDQPFTSSEIGDSMDLSGETWVRSGLFCRSIQAGCGLDHCTQVGPVRNGPCVVGVCGIISGAAVLAATGQESVGGHRGEIMASPGPSGDVLSAGSAGF